MNGFLTRLFEPKSNAADISYILTQLLNVNISKNTIKTELEEHPNYPSLLSISDLLSNYGVENLSIQLELIKIIDVPVPFITQIRGRKQSIDFFTIVKQISNDGILFFDPEKYQWEFTDFDSFLKRCSGVVLLTDIKDTPGEKDYIKNRKAEKRRVVNQNLTAFWLPAIVILAGVIAFMQTGIHAVLPIIFSLLTLAGTIVCVLLFWYELDQHNPLLQQICNSGKKVNCGAILQSKAAKIAGISWSSIGLTFFAGTLFLLLFGWLTNPATLFVASVLNMAAVSYVFYSVYYQWRVAKQWCALCLSIQAILVLQLITICIGKWYSISFSTVLTFQTFTQAVTAFSIPFIVISILFPALRKARESTQVKIDLRRLKNNKQVFQALLTEEKEITQNPEGLGITLGNPNAAIKIIKVCNPYCGPCAKAHADMEELLSNTSNVQMQIIFSVSNDDSDYRNRPAKHLLALNQQGGDPEVLKKALDDWYLSETKDYEGFAAKYPMNGELKLQGQKILEMEEWCNNVDISFTPTFFISVPTLPGGSIKTHQLPRMYNITDLKYLLSVNLE